MGSTLFKTIRLGVVAAAISAAGSVFALALPAVSSCGYPPPNDNLLCYTAETGAQLYVASAHDDFISYSANALKQYGSMASYSSLAAWASLPSFGSGQIVKLYSFNNSNNGTFPDATSGTGDNKTAPNADLTPKHDGFYSGNWPVGGIVTVGDLKAFLGTGVNTPVFSFDLNNTSDLLLNGYLTVTSAGGSLLDTFAFDNITNSMYDAASLVTASASQVVSWVDAANSLCDATSHICTITVHNNVGSGKPDFFAYAPTFDLYDYADTAQLNFFLHMTGLNAGGEELALNSFVTATQVVPEPGALALLSIVLLALGLSRRKNGAV